MHLLPFIKKLVSVLGLALVITSSWLCYATGTVTGNGIISQTKDSLSHTLLKAVNRSTHSPLVSPDQSTLPDDSNLQELTQGLHPGRGESIPDAKDVNELPVVDVSFYNKRHNLLSGWLAIHTPLAPVIILAHGTPGNRVSMIQRSAFLYNHGYNVLLFDFQSYGRSQGIMSTLGIVESEDILAAIDYLHTLPDTSHSKIGVLGLSMGATAAALAASKTEDISALVLESCPVDATRVPGDVPDDAARDADRQLVERVYGVDITEARPIDVVGNFPGHPAVFFINGDVDTITPLSGMQELFQTAGNPKQYWIVPTAEHAQSFDVDTAGYIARVDAFFDTYLS
ncbi:MAG TPA: alpha/beta hydrolase [Ktedonobacteraceae bacterium]|jgi:pimeloyl-ACP methyl ester carboxylesterase